MSFLTLTLILFLIMDPIGNVSSFLSLTKGMDKKKRAFVLTREMLFALGFMLLFDVVGEWIFNIFQLSEVTVKLSSGLILFLFALQILFPTLNSIRQNLPKDEPFLIPIAIPLIAGPSLLATIMLFARIVDNHFLMIGAILTAWLAAFIILLCSQTLKRFLGENGLIACEKLMGMVLVLLAIQRFLDGVKQFLETGAAT